MPQILPASSVLNDGRRINSAYGAPLRPLIMGPKAGLHRYAVAAEKANILLGTYNPNDDETFDYPDKTDDSIVDLSSVKLYMDDARLKYFERYVGVASGTVAPVANYKNRIVASGLTFKSYTNAAGTSYARSADFYDRDVAVGDVVYIRGTVGGDTFEHTSTVNGFVNDVVAASISTAVIDSSNAANQIASSSITQVADTPVNEVDATIDHSAYDGLADGDINETYTITVTQSSTGSDATTARLSVKSASGRDDQAEITPAAFGAPTDIGTRGLTVTFDLNGTPGVSETVDLNDFVVGQKWTATVAQAWTRPGFTSGGTPATGMPTTTYIVTVSRGGTFVDPTPPQITVSTTTGVDVSGPTDVAVSTATAVGIYGVTITFTGSALRKGDIYHIPVTGVQQGAIKTLTLKNSISEDLLAATNLDLILYIEKDGYLVTENRLPSPPDKNWEAAASDFTVHDGLEVFEDTWTDGGTLMALPVTSGSMYLEYREWLVDDANQVIDIDDTASVESLFGTVDPQNPMAYAVSKALANTGYAVLGGTKRDIDVVKAVILGGDPTETATWTDALEAISGVEDIYNVVPLTDLQAVKDAVVAHVADESLAESGAYRATILSLTAPTALDVRVLDDSDDVILAKLVQDPSVTSTSYSMILVESGTPNFVTSGVRAGDTVRYFYTTDGFGGETYTEFTVESVESEDSLILTTANDTAVNVAQKMEVVRYPTKSEIVADLIDQAEAYSNRRVVAVWPDSIGDSGETVSGYYLAAAIAGLIGSIAPHQGITNVEVLGFDDVPRSKTFFNNSQLQDLSDGGVFVVSQAPDSTVYVRKAVTTEVSGIENREELVRRDTDAAAIAIMDKWGAYTGNANNIPTTYAAMQGDFTAAIGQMRSDTFLPRLGSMVTGGSINELRSHAVLADRAVANITLSVPFPLNKIELTVVL